MTQRRAPAEVVRRALAVDPGIHPARRQTQGLTEGAVLAALTAVIAAVGLVIPFVGILLAPLPVMLLVIRWGMRTAVLAAVVAGLILLQFFGPLTAFSVVAFGPIGLALGWCARRNLAASRAIVVGAIALTGSFAASLALARFALHQDFLNQFIELMVKSEVSGFQASLDMVERMGLLPPEFVKQWRDTLTVLPQFLTAFSRALLPLMTGLGMLTWSYFCYQVARAVLRRVGYEIASVPPMLGWRIPAGPASALLYAAAGLSLASWWVPALSQPAFNAVWLNLFVFGFLGSLVAIVWMNVKRIPRIAQIITFVLISTAGLIPLLALAILGILDSWYDYRRLTATPASGTATPPEMDEDASPAERHPQANAR